MATEESTHLTTWLTTAQTLDTSRVATDPFKLPTTLRADVNADRTALIAADTATDPAEGGRTGGVAAQRGVLTELERQLRGGHRGIAGIDEETITEGQRMQVFVSYGWPGGEIGRFDDTRVLAMARLAGTISATEAGNAAWLYTPARLARIAAQLAIYDAAESVATGADSQFATLLRDTAVKNAAMTLLRVRFLYCSATRDGDKTPELVRIGYQPRRDPGEAGGGSSSSSSSSSSAVPTAPQNVTVQPGSSGSGAVQAASEPVSGAAAYNFYVDGILKATAADPSALLEGFTSGDSVTVIIKAENAAGEGPGSEPVTGTAG